METQSGDSYIRQLAAFIRANERGLAESGLARRRRNPRQNLPSPSSFSPLSWFSPSLSPPSCRPVVLSIDTHHLFYILIRLEALGFDIGPLDIRVDSPSRPMSYTHIYPNQKDAETLSLASLRSSLSIVSKISLSGSWWTNYDAPGIDGELRYVYSSFTKLPALSIHAPGKQAIAELMNDSPDQNAIPLYVFKNLERLECENIDPRTLLGWDRLSESLKSLKIKKSGLDDVSDIIAGAVLDDLARRRGEHLTATPRLSPLNLSLEATEDECPNSGPNKTVSLELPSPPRLSSSTWAFLKHLYLPDNALTSFPSEVLPYLTSLTHLDLSSNLLLSVPAGFGELYSLLSLNLADNLIDSVLGIFLNLGQILSLNLAHNRLESLCGLERLLALERLDLRYNLLEESSEISRLSALPNLSELWIEGNHFVEVEERYRVTCFDYFWREGKEISLDGTLPNMYERRNLNPPDQVPSLRVQSTTASTPVIAIEHSRTPLIPGAQQKDVTSSQLPHSLIPTATSGVGLRRKKLTRIVDLEENNSEQSSPSGSHSRTGSKDSTRRPRTLQAATLELLSDKSSSPHSTEATGENRHIPQYTNEATEETQAFRYGNRTNHASAFISQPPRHSRNQTDYIHRLSVLPPPREQSDLLSHKSVRVGSIISKSERRRARISASFFEPSGSDGIVDDSMDSYRKKIESLKQDMGDSWLKVYNQSHSP
ncbi:hypothetical protein GALMADRAFT_248769 [Galerina marginata CBS 339.88]|uniref:Uncharacterized protein n=1 Tax=Galerina marginata (strain CBS 339.88) TaxID=685588 RepID=A0A067TAH1_GALM3|nr:hypothetical protein GALMADRAFT_248769 [Galerina marginata CBS 339.88]